MRDEQLHLIFDTLQAEFGWRFIVTQFSAAAREQSSTEMNTLILANNLHVINFLLYLKNPYLTFSAQMFPIAYPLFRYNKMSEK
jgi:hypothetical protein